MSVFLCKFERVYRTRELISDILDEFLRLGNKVGNAILIHLKLFSKVKNNFVNIEDVCKRKQTESLITLGYSHLRFIYVHQVYIFQNQTINLVRESLFEKNNHAGN